MTDPLATTPIKMGASNQDSPTSSAASAAPSSPHADEFSAAQMKQLQELIQPLITGAIQPLGERMSNMEEKMSNMEEKMSNIEEKVDNMGQEMNNMGQEMNNMGERMNKMEKTVGHLVEEKARKMASRQFGGDFSRHFIIKSIHHLVKLISNSNMTKLKKDDYKAHNAEVEKLMKILKPLLCSFYKAAINSVHKQVQDHPAFADEVFTRCKETFQKGVIDRLNEDSVDWGTMIGSTLGLLQSLTEPQKGEEPKSEAVSDRKKILNSRFKRKLERLKTATQGNLDSCDSAGILLLSALADGGEDVWNYSEEAQRKWIEENCNVFDYKEEIECDLTPSVSVVEKHATIVVGEIKTSIQRYSEAKAGMIYMAKLLHLGLWVVIGGPLESVDKSGHIFVLEADADDQRLSGKLDKGISIFVHKAD